MATPNTATALVARDVHTDLVTPPATPRSAAVEARLRSQLDPQGVRELADRLFRELDPTDPSTGVSALFRDLPRLFSASIHEPIHKRFFQVMANGGFLYLQSAAPGVGSRTLAAEEARSFNIRAEERKIADRAVHLQLVGRTRSDKQLLDSLAEATRAPVTQSELRLRSSERIGKRIVAGLQDRSIRTLIISNVRKLAPPVLDTLTDFGRLCDPRYSVVVDPDLEPPSRPVGLILVDHVDPRALFRDHLELLQWTSRNWAVLYPYREPEELAEALRHADIGLDDISLDDVDDLTFVEMLLTATDGLATYIEPVLQRVDVIMAASGFARPCPVVLEVALRHFNRLTSLQSREGSDGRRYYNTTAVRTPDPFSRPQPTSAPTKSTSKRKVSDGSKRREKREARPIAAGEGKRMARRGHTNLPPMRS